MDLKVFFVSLSLILIFDFIWIQLIMGKFYSKEFSKIGRKEKGKLKPKLLPGLIAYLIIALGVSIFAIPLSNTPLTSLIYGTLFGLIIYGAYDLTNISVLKDYSRKLAIIDIIWGTILLGIVSFLTRIICIK